MSKDEGRGVVIKENSLGLYGHSGKISGVVIYEVEMKNGAIHNFTEREFEFKDNHKETD